MLNWMMADELKADVLIGSDGPRLQPERPTLFMGSRGSMVFDVAVDLREGAHHSGNWGGLIANPALVLANALASVADKRGQIKVPEWRPTSLTNSIRMALADCEVDGGEAGRQGLGDEVAAIDADHAVRVRVADEHQRVLSGPRRHHIDQ